MAAKPGKAHPLVAPSVHEREARLVLLGHGLGRDVKAVPDRPRARGGCRARSRSGRARAARRGRRGRWPRCRAAGPPRRRGRARRARAGRAPRAPSGPAPGRCPRSACRGRSRPPACRAGPASRPGRRPGCATRSRALRPAGITAPSKALPPLDGVVVVGAAAGGQHRGAEGEHGHEHERDRHPGVHFGEGSSELQQVALHLDRPPPR